MFSIADLRKACTGRRQVLALAKQAQGMKAVIARRSCRKRTFNFAVKDAQRVIQVEVSGHLCESGNSSAYSSATIKVTPIEIQD